MTKKIAILTSGHLPFDERIYWKFGISLTENNYSVQIICSTEEIEQENSKISIKGFYSKNLNKRNKITKFIQTLNTFSPDIIICGEMFTILPAFLYKISRNRNCRIISDITEWYPENVAFKYGIRKKYSIYFFLFILNIILTNLTNGLIIGEKSKKRRYDLIAPFKKKIIISYYPVIKFFNYTAPQYDGKSLILCYAGLINFNRGILRLLKIANLISDRHNDLKVTLRIIGNFQFVHEENIFNELIQTNKKIAIEQFDRTDYNNISNLINDADICFDLRERNFIYDNSLPIKIFEYMACGKPIIFSDIRPIREELGEINCGFLVNPNNKEEIVNKIESYISDKNLLIQHSKNGRSIIENSKNWEEESEKLISFINQLSNSK